MGFPTVKSDPWKKGLRRHRRRFRLWPDAFWKKLCERAKEDFLQHRDRDVSLACREMIREMNFLLYEQP